MLQSFFSAIVYRPIEMHVTDVVYSDEESVVKAPPTAAELQAAVAKPPDWMDDRCFVCQQQVEYLTGVYQTTGCTRHFGATVTSTLGVNKNTLNLVHMGACYEKYVDVLRRGGSNCTLCSGNSLAKPPAENETHHATPGYDAILESVVLANAHMNFNRPAAYPDCDVYASHHGHHAASHGGTGHFHTGFASHGHHSSDYHSGDHGHHDGVFM